MVMDRRDSLQDRTVNLGRHNDVNKGEQHTCKGVQKRQTERKGEPRVVLLMDRQRTVQSCLAVD